MVVLCEGRGGFGGLHFEHLARNFSTLFVRASTWMKFAGCLHRVQLTTTKDWVMGGRVCGIIETAELLTNLMTTLVVGLRTLRGRFFFVVFAALHTGAALTGLISLNSRCIARR